MQGWKREGMSSDQLQQYCKRIGASDEVLAKATQKQADMDLLKEIITLQLLSVPFENLGLVRSDHISLRIPGSLDDPEIAANIDHGMSLQTGFSPILAHIITLISVFSPTNKMSLKLPEKMIVLCLDSGLVRWLNC